MRSSQVMQLFSCPVSRVETFYITQMSYLLELRFQITCMGNIDGKLLKGKTPRQSTCNGM